MSIDALNPYSRIDAVAKKRQVILHIDLSIYLSEYCRLFANFWFHRNLSRCLTQCFLLCDVTISQTKQTNKPNCLIAAKPKLESLAPATIHALWLFLFFTFFTCISQHNFKTCRHINGSFMYTIERVSAVLNRSHIKQLPIDLFWQKFQL